MSTSWWVGLDAPTFYKRAKHEAKRLRLAGDRDVRTPLNFVGHIKPR